ncbi:hypothetical protein [Acetobacter fallax]|uniref:Mu-like prophage FluMu N-terminal domain-containing protein n=1 Tax=Acetobacter fallax TaxID=1737473 RepID=A0ABX0KA91_9PROT|nr:hypothetical protein [Acetobacter fallax]NHO33325.1 hypothetical protein [Acetobacter fallax]NHO36946.1 hypothetical protein [Acetobacter fallax]
MSEETKKAVDAAVAFAGGADILSRGDGTIAVPGGSVIVVCRRPGFRRAGIEHKGLEIYADGDLSEETVAAIAADPQFEVIRVR